MKKLLFGKEGIEILGEASEMTGKSNFVGRCLGRIHQYFVKKDQKRQLLNFLFATSHPIVGGGGNDHIQKDKVQELKLLDGEYCYPHDKKSLESIAAVLLGNAPIIPVPEVSDYIPKPFKGSIIVVGSSVSSPITREFLGTVFKPRTSLHTERYKAYLKYNYSAPDTEAEVEYTIDGRDSSLREMNWGIIMPGDTQFPHIGQDDRLVDDLLLITRLPSQVKGAGDIIIIGGTHGPGCQAIDLIFKKMDTNTLQKWVDKIKNRAHYQALFRVTDLEDIDGHTVANDIKLVDACPVDIEWARDANWTK